MCVYLYYLQGAALGAMVGQMTFGNRKYESLDSVMRCAIPPLHDAVQTLLPLIDRDVQAFQHYMVGGLLATIDCHSD